MPLTNFKSEVSFLLLFVTFLITYAKSFFYKSSIFSISCLDSNFKILSVFFALFNHSSYMVSFVGGRSFPSDNFLMTRC